jgi:hypothetical protein
MTWPLKRITDGFGSPLGSELVVELTAVVVPVVELGEGATIVDDGAAWVDEADAPSPSPA